MILDWQYGSRQIWLTVALMLLLTCCPRVVAEPEITLGPYDSVEDLAKVTDFLDANKIPFNSNQDAVHQTLGFIVVTAQLSPASATITIGKLQDEQVKDVVFVKTGVYGNRISAGVFGSEKNADNRAAKLSRYGFSVLERTRTLSSASITVFRADISPSLEEKFQTITGVQIPPATVAVDIEKAIVEQPEPEPVLAIVPPLESVESEKKVTTAQSPKKETFPYIPFLLIATFVVIVVGLGYYYLGRRSGQPITVQVGIEKDPQQPPLYQEVIRQAQRQLDSSVGAISAYANQLLGGQSPTTEEVPQYIATIRSGGIEVLDLISDIIDLSRIEIGQVEIERITFDPESALEDLVKSLSQKAELKGISLHFNPDENLPNLVAADPAKLEKILSILVSYAIENTESGRVLITATFLGQMDSLKITIEHTSENFNSLIISEMFEPIESTSGINSEQRLRFAVSKRLANLMGGDIQIMSQSDHDIQYIVTVHADEILKKQLLLPSGVSIDELVQSEAQARELADNAQQALVAAQTQTQQAAQAQSEAEAKLAREVEAKTSAEARAEADATARIE
ncbi:MAG: ATP-binding protein [Gammaproteobacteria bacterium]|nr:ATP-binding protein [Gammaproteobacteria bacterium]